MQRLWAVCYDIADPRRLRRVAAVLEEAGMRVQESVFECRLDAQSLMQLRAEIATMIDRSCDSVRYYPMCAACTSTLAWQGPGNAPGEPMYWLV